MIAPPVQLLLVLPPSGKAAMWGGGGSSHLKSFPLSDTSQEPAASTAPMCLSLRDLHVLLFITELNGSWKVFFPSKPRTCNTLNHNGYCYKSEREDFPDLPVPICWVSEQLLMFFPFCFQWLQLPHWKCWALCTQAPFLNSPLYA